MRLLDEFFMHRLKSPDFDGCDPPKIKVYNKTEYGLNQFKEDNVYKNYDFLPEAGRLLICISLKAARQAGSNA